MKTILFYFLLVLALPPVLSLPPTAKLNGLSNELSMNVAVAADADLPTFVDERLAGRGVLGVEIAPQGRLLKRAPAGWA